MSFLKGKTDHRYLDRFQSLQKIDDIVVNGLTSKFDTDKVNVTWTNTQQWFKVLRQKIIDKNRQLKFPSVAIARTTQQINWQRPNIPPITGAKYQLSKKQIQAGRYDPKLNLYEPAEWQIIQCDPPQFIKRVYSVFIVSNFQTDYNQLVQDMYSILQGGRTYLVKQQSVRGRVKQLFNRYGVYVYVTGQSSQVFNSIDRGSRIFQKQFTLSTQTYLYRNIEKIYSKNKVNVTFING